MCIAIVKYAGKPISEEHLHNGWLNNDDGAGFACIDENGEFLIHRAMKWEEFFPAYQEAVAKYGDTSDFLIHFRITSRGDTNLDNCHPFMAGENRVIIHNGTISDIPHDKAGGRSDTRILAEDYIPNLPEDWENNKTIVAMFESFIGWSKIAELHKTEGIYIFNESKGYHFEDNWYSNETYKNKPVTTYNYYKNKGFYSYILMRWVSDFEAEAYSATEIAAHKEYVKDEKYNWPPQKGQAQSYSKVYERCANCHQLSDADEMFVREFGSLKEEKWCIDCVENSDYCDHCEQQYSLDKLNEYWSFINAEKVVLCNECYDLCKDVTQLELLNETHNTDSVPEQLLLEQKDNEEQDEEENEEENEVQGVGICG